MNAIERLTCQAALAKLLSDPQFSICTVDNILKVTQTVPDGRLYRALSLLHCVNYRDMPPELLQELPGMLAQIFKGPLLEVPGINFTVDKAGKPALSVTRAH